MTSLKSSVTCSQMVTPTLRVSYRRMRCTCMCMYIIHVCVDTRTLFRYNVRYVNITILHIINVYTVYTCKCGSPM